MKKLYSKPLCDVLPGWVEPYVLCQSMDEDVSVTDLDSDLDDDDFFSR